KQGQVRTGARTKFLAEFPVFDLDSELSFGAELSREWYDLSIYENLYQDFPGSGSVRGVILSNNTQNRSYYNIFAQWNLEFSEKWNLEAGINYNSTSYELSDLYVSDGTDQSGAYEFPSVFSPRLGLTYDISNSKIFYASVSHGFSIPTVAQTLTPEGMINTALQPETGINYEAGFKGSWLGNKLYSEIAIYTVQVENLLVAERVAEDRYIGRNAGETDHSGIELLLNYNIRFNEDIRAKIYANAAFNFFKFDRFIDDGINYSGNLIPGVPDNTITGGIDLMIGSGFKFSAFHQYVGEIPLNDANSIYAEEYRLLNLKTSYSFDLFEGINLKIFGGLNNVLDEKYAASILPNAVGFGGSDPRYYYPGKPLNYFLGIELGFDF
ncbi:MAG TPA: TonB-dependent receptor, partial [Salinimicrobium sp.]|nr:TonB-dependent receptor [Salinimicrobium sp.]